MYVVLLSALHFSRLWAATRAHWPDPHFFLLLQIAESLYQKGFVSYPRTETDQYDKDFDFQTLIEKQSADNDWGAFAARLNAGEYERPRNGKKNDKAHPPIHPTAHANNLSGDDRRVYELITRRFLASCSKDGIGRETSVEIEIAEETFSAHGMCFGSREYDHQLNSLSVVTTSPQVW